MHVAKCQNLIHLTYLGGARSKHRTRTSCSRSGIVAGVGHDNLGFFCTRLSQGSPRFCSTTHFSTVRCWSAFESHIFHDRPGVCVCEFSQAVAERCHIHCTCCVCSKQFPFISFARRSDTPCFIIVDAFWHVVNHQERAA